jgi:hypothetical protein
MIQHRVVDVEVVPREPGEFGIITEHERGWRGYSVGSRDDAYAELDRRDEQQYRGSLVERE